MIEAEGTCDCSELPKRTRCFSKVMWIHIYIAITNYSTTYKIVASKVITIARFWDITVVLFPINSMKVAKERPK